MNFMGQPEFWQQDPKFSPLKMGWERDFGGGRRGADEEGEGKFLSYGGRR